MAVQLTCPQGHQYTLPDNASAPTLDGPARCPVCDEAATLPPSGPDEPLVSDLLSRWQERFSRGQDVSAAELCRDRPDLIATLTQRIAAIRALNQLVVQQSTSPNLSEQPTAGSLSDTPPTPDAARPAPALPGYVILGELGRGGMGVVYKAQQAGLNRLVALKMILSGEYAGAAELQRFQVEAEAIARLQHPHIVQIHEVGTHRGLPYFSLEFCPGGSLDRKLNGTPLPPKEAAALVEVLARAMQAAHDKGVIHRDLKPANVLLGEAGEPKITDFGLAKKLEEAGQTHSGAVMGSPSYMAPEQAQGQSKAVGPAADVYALGAILYECLTGRPPFKAATAVDTLLQVLSEAPVPPSVLQRKLPSDLETICMKCLEKDIPRRYPSAVELAEDLGHFLKGEPIRAQRPTALLRFRYWIRRPERMRDAGIIQLGLAVLAVSTQLVIIYGTLQRASTIPNSALQRASTIPNSAPLRKSNSSSPKLGDLFPEMSKMIDKLGQPKYEPKQVNWRTDLGVPVFVCFFIAIECWLALNTIGRRRWAIYLGLFIASLKLVSPSIVLIYYSIQVNLSIASIIAMHLLFLPSAIYRLVGFFAYVMAFWAYRANRE